MVVEGNVLSRQISRYVLKKRHRGLGSNAVIGHCLFSFEMWVERRPQSIE